MTAGSAVKPREDSGRTYIVAPWTTNRPGACSRPASQRLSDCSRACRRSVIGSASRDGGQRVNACPNPNLKSISDTPRYAEPDVAPFAPDRFADPPARPSFSNA